MEPAPLFIEKGGVMRLGDLANSPPARTAAAPRWTVVAAPLLESERVVVVTVDADAPAAARAHPDLTVYLAREMRELERHAARPDLVGAAHHIKRVLDAQIIPRDSALGAWSRERTAIPVERLLGHNTENDNDE